MLSIQVYFFSLLLRFFFVLVSELNFSKFTSNRDNQPFDKLFVEGLLLRLMIETLTEYVKSSNKINAKISGSINVELQSFEC